MASRELFGIDLALSEDWLVHCFEINARPGIEGKGELKMVDEIEALNTAYCILNGHFPVRFLVKMQKEWRIAPES